MEFNPYELPFPYVKMTEPVRNNTHHFHTECNSYLNYGISWFLPEWDIKRMASLGRNFEYYSYSFGLAQIPDFPQSKDSITACILTQNN